MSESSTSRGGLRFAGERARKLGRGAGRACSVCVHRERAAIDEALVAGRHSLRDIARQYGLSKDAVDRHGRRHLPARLAQAVRAQDLASASSLLEQLEALHTKTLAILESATDPRTALAAVQQARGNLQLLAELTGKLATQPTVQVAMIELPALNQRQASAPHVG